LSFSLSVQSLSWQKDRFSSMFTIKLRKNGFFPAPLLRLSEHFRRRVLIDVRESTSQQPSCERSGVVNLFDQRVPQFDYMFLRSFSG